MSKSRGSPRKFSEKIALLNKKEAEGTAEFEKILKEVEETTRTSPQPLAHLHQQQLYYQPPASGWPAGSTVGQQQLGAPEQHHYQAQLLPPAHSNHQYHLSLQTPANVPNINIFPIHDESLQPAAPASPHQQNHTNHYEQSQQQVTPGYRNLDCSSNHMSAARSLPDIANLRVSGSLCSQLGPSYSDRRIAHPSAEEGYAFAPGECFQAFGFESAHASPAESGQQQWHCLPPDQQQFEEPASLHSVPQGYPLDQRFVQRANSTNGALLGWQPDQQQQLSPQRAGLNPQLSKSSEPLYAYSKASSPLELPLSDTTTSDCFPNDQQLQEPNYRLRSSSYNSIDHFHADRRLDKSAHQQPSENQSQPAPPEQPQLLHQQPLYTSAHLDYQFYQQ